MVLGARGKEKVLQGMLVKKVHVTPQFIHLLYFAYVKSQPWGYIFSPLLTLGIYFQHPFDIKGPLLVLLKQKVLDGSPSRLFPTTNNKCGNPVTRRNRISKQRKSEKMEKQRRQNRRKVTGTGIRLGFHFGSVRELGVEEPRGGVASVHRA